MTSPAEVSGAATRSVDRPDSRAALGLPSDCYLLVIEQQSVRVFPLPESGQIYLGREVGPAGLTLTDQGASRRHALLRLSSEGASITDLSSHNGTRLNGVPVRHATALYSEDVISVADTILIFKRSVADVSNERKALSYLGRSVNAVRTRVAAAIESAAHHGRPVSLLLLSFATSNACPALAVEVASVLSDNALLLETAEAGRLLILLPDLDEEDAQVQAQELAQWLADHGHSAAIGLASAPRHGASLDDLWRAVFAAADRATTGMIVSASALIQTFEIGNTTVQAVDQTSIATLDLLRRLAPSQLSILLAGETGTGKELAAQALHAWSPRSEKPFVSINCAAIPRDLLEGELFGHEKGAFSGAVAPRLGLMEIANGGTLFLDELGELPLDMQAKLLRVLETRRVRRIGGNDERLLDFRLVAATHRDLAAEVAAGRFREDLFFRIQHTTIRLLPLRERTRELTVLAQEFLDRACRSSGLRRKQLSVEALYHLRRQSWPGNLRQLKNAMEVAAVLSPTTSALLLACHLPALSTEPASPVAESVAPPLPPFRPLAEQVAELEAQQMVAAWRAAGGHKDAAAEFLRMPRSTFHHKWRQYQLTGTVRP